jgi:hypothetical protein
MENLETWRGAITASLEDLFSTLLGFLPNLIAAIIVLVVGLLVASSLGKLVVKLVQITRVDDLIDKLGVNKTFKAFGKIKVSVILGWLLKWFLILVVLMAVADILGLTQIIEFLREVAEFLPNVVVATVILLIGFVGGNFVYEIVHRSVKAAKMHSPKFLASLAKWAIIIFALMASLIQLNIASSLVQTLFTGFIAMISLAGGIAFGLGGQESAKIWLKSVKKKL